MVARVLGAAITTDADGQVLSSAVSCSTGDHREYTGIAARPGTAEFDLLPGVALPGRPAQDVPPPVPPRARGTAQTTQSS